MKKTPWIITGGSCVIAKEFAHIVAQHGAEVLLIGRDKNQLAIICADIRCRYRTICDYYVQDFTQDLTPLLNTLNKKDAYNLFLAHADGVPNEQLNASAITHCIKTNIEASTQLVHAYWNASFPEKNIIFISSVAAKYGRSKNSLYGASKAAMEVYLQGLQQSCAKEQHILIARAGFIDTQQTFGLPGVFYAAPARSFAKRLWQSHLRQKHLIYYPRFWRVVMGIFSFIPWVIYKKMKGL